ncbi:MAG: hypothetical protein R8K46_07345, partial [Mariprofundaceae bacterium]
TCLIWQSVHGLHGSADLISISLTSRFFAIAGENSRWEGRLEIILLAVMLFVFFAFFSTSIWDIDFWWHIASGRYIFTELAIPSADPFGTYADMQSLRAQTVLKAQWLGQSLLYLGYQAFGENGIISLKAAVLSCCLLILFLRTRQLRVPAIFGLFIVFLAGMTLLHSTSARPQLFSFLFVGLMFLCIDRFQARNNQKALLWLTPIMWLWANCHGGFVLGAALLGLVIFVLLLGNQARANSKAIAFLVVAIMATLLTPNGVDTYIYILDFGSSSYKGMTTDYLSPLKAWASFPYYWLAAALACLSLIKLATKSTLLPCLVLASLLLISLDAVRYIPFLMLAGGPYIAAGLGKWFEGVNMPEHAIIALAILATLAVFATGISRQAVFQQGVNPVRYPIKAVEFIKQNQLHGRAFNHMNWGGYLTWKLFPELSIYIDGRVQDDDRLASYTNVLWATPYGVDVFESEGFDLVLIPYGNPVSGEPYTLNQYLMNHPRWQPIYSDGQGMMFARRQG